jgi:hypothetical protein
VTAQETTVKDAAEAFGGTLSESSTRSTASSPVSMVVDREGVGEVKPAGALVSMVMGT